MKVITAGNSAAAVAEKTNWKAYFKRYWQLYVLLLLPMIYLLVFKYVPMKYVLIAFKKYSIVQKVGEMPWADNLPVFYSGLSQQRFLKCFEKYSWLEPFRFGYWFPNPNHLRINP